MDELEIYRRRAAVGWAAHRRLGVPNVLCVCGETDPRCFEAEHVNRQMYDNVIWGCCKNCHAKKTSREQSEHPTVGIYPGDPFERAGHRFLGAAMYLTFCVEGLRKDAAMMFKLAGKGIVIED